MAVHDGAVLHLWVHDLVGAEKGDEEEGAGDQKRNHPDDSDLDPNDRCRSIASHHRVTNAEKSIDRYGTQVHDR